MHRVRVGAVDCVVVNDGDLALPPEVLFPPARRAEWPALSLDERGYYSFPINCLLVWSAGQTILIDAGNGNKPSNRWPGGGRLLEELAAAGVQPGDLDLVVLTHTHGDHVGWNTVLQDDRLVLTFPRARYVAPRADWEHYTSPAIVERFAFVRDNLLPLRDSGKLELVDGEVDVTADVRMLPAPGHTPGHCVVAVSSRGETAIHLGDLFHHRIQFEKPDLVRDQDDLPDLVPGSRGRIAALALERDALVLAAHDGHPGLGRLVRTDGAARFQPLG
ncbi:MAG: MBL fold metallo-hydrolase [Chloroflexi bacterium]|nr:MBL fold metallo-hydrolase [Chloroflexota bacterium]